MKLVNFKLLAILLITYCFAMVALMPLSWIAPAVEDQLATYGVTLESPQGSIWQGDSLVKIKQVGEANVSWDIKPLSLLLLKVPIAFEVENRDLSIQGTATASLSGLALKDLRGYIDESAFESIYTQYEASISGRLQLRDVNANVSWSNELGEANGALTWSGGPISFPVGRSVESFEVPQIAGTITSDDQQWLMQARGSEQQDYLNASLTREGSATLSIKRQLAVDMNIPVPGSGSSLFDVSQKVF